MINSYILFKFLFWNYVLKYYLKKGDKESFSLNTMTEFQAELREIGDVISLENIKKFGLLF